MYRQIQIDDADVSWQWILWCCRPEDTVQQYDLTTVAYGTACAPYLALRVMQQLADDEESRFPTGARILRKHMYVDDVLVSCDSEAEAIDASTSLTSILQSAGMKLDKWASNYPSILPQGHTTAAPDLTFNKELCVSTLGLRWIPKTDVFSYTVPALVSSSIITKRSILSEIAGIFDPTGWIAPVTVRAKILLQHLWLLGRDWDQLADPTTTRMWISFHEQFPALQQCQIPRWLRTRSKSNVIYHGFSDASEKAYGATVYLVSENKAHLVAAKSKVAPIRTVSLPRLELCGATLPSRLLSKTLEDLGVSNPTVYCWTDSQIVLAWLRAPPNTWKNFVANRVSEVHTLLPNAAWGHVVSKQNPADLATRGCTPEQLNDNTLWWRGPPWIVSAANYPRCELTASTQLEKWADRICLTTTQEDTIETILAHFSSLDRLYRVIAYCRRAEDHGGGNSCSANGNHSLSPILAFLGGNQST
uniref:Reverse transcriptase domain-containing protein n=1 Tax=Trichogramma kaykai TaxID=54128 RepID=A0ABD2W6D5_9HYME